MENAVCIKSENADVTSDAVCPQALRKSRLSIATIPMAPHCLSALPWTSSKPGVASLLFHRTLSPSDALQVHTYAAKATLCKPQPPRLQDFRKSESESESEPSPELKHSVDAHEVRNTSMPNDWVGLLDDITNYITTLFLNIVDF